MKKIKFCALVLALLMLLGQATVAEEAYVNLDDRFADVATYEHDGATYYMKDRVSTTLVMCANLFEDAAEGVGSAELILLLPIDDDAKTATPIQIEGSMRAAWLEGEDGEKTLSELFSEAEDAEAACAKLVEALNALFPSAVIEHYATLDLRGLPVLDGVENDETNVSGDALVERLKAVKAQAEQGAKDANSMLSALSSYIVTDMKSGALMKVVDKVDRYDRAHRTPFPVVEAAADAAEAALEPDLDAFEEMMIGIYYDDTRMW